MPTHVEDSLLPFDQSSEDERARPSGRDNVLSFHLEQVSITARARRRDDQKGNALDNAI